MELEILRFLQYFSLSNQYKTECTKYISGVEYTENDFQTYKKINGQHLYNIAEFIRDTLENNAQNSKITIKNDNWSITFIVTDSNGKKVFKREIKGE